MQVIFLKKLPKEFQKLRREKNLLRYKDFQILVAAEKDQVVGSVRIGVNVDNSHGGLITDLFGGKGLIGAAEKELKKLGVKRVDAYYLDGPGKLSHYHSLGYVPERRTVEIEWDLLEFPIFNFQFSIKFKIKKSNDQKKLEELLLDSFQPYWSPWSKKRLPRFSRNDMWIAYKGKQAIGMVDERLKIGVVIRKGFGGDGLGSALLNTALSNLKKKGKKKARMLATSGLDDYDPQIYLYTMNGGKIVREYINLQKML